MIKKNTCLISLFALVIIALSACNDTILYDNVYSIPKKGWEAGKSIDFEMSVQDTAKSYDLLFHLRNTGRYDYSNLWLFIQISAPNGSVTKDTFEIMLADPSGRWYGKGIGDINKMEVPYKSGVVFLYRGIYKIAVKQGMREPSNILENIVDLGLCLRLHK